MTARASYGKQGPQWACAAGRNISWINDTSHGKHLLMQKSSSPAIKFVLKNCF